MWISYRSNRFSSSVSLKLPVRPAVVAAAATLELVPNKATNAALFTAGVCSSLLSNSTIGFLYFPIRDFPLSVDSKLLKSTCHQISA